MNNLNESMSFPIEDFINDVLKENESPPPCEATEEEILQISSANYLACSLYVECERATARLESAKANLQGMESRIRRRSATVAEDVRDYFAKCRQDLAKREHQLLKEVAYRSMAAEEDLRAQLHRVEEMKDRVETRASELKSDIPLSLGARMKKYERIAKELNALRSVEFGAREADLFSPEYKLLNRRLPSAPTLDYFVVAPAKNSPGLNDGASSASGDSGIESSAGWEV